MVHFVNSSYLIYGSFTTHANSEMARAEIYQITGNNKNKPTLLFLTESLSGIDGKKKFSAQSRGLGIEQ